MKKIKFYIVLWLCKFINICVTKIRKNGGTMISGKIATKLEKKFIANFKNIDYDKVIMITGTNGKTSTTNLVAYTIKNSGKAVATNSEGSNMLSGVATTLIKNSNIKGEFNKEYLILEIDERSIEAIHEQLPAKHLCITNLLKDQVQRNGDPNYIFRKISNIITKEMTLYLNNEEPRSKGLEDKAGKVLYYSVEKNEKTFTRNNFFTVTLPCPKCDGKIKYNYYNIENIGDFQCTNCKYKSEENPDVKIKNINFEQKTFEVENEKYKITYNLPFYIYNYAICLTICKNFNIEAEKIKQVFETFSNPFERREIIQYKDKEIKYLRMKQENPETLQNALNTIAQDKTKKAILIGLFEIKDFPPAYANTFYFFDCNFEEIAESEVEKYIAFSKTVAYDTANRMMYAGVEREKIEIIDSDNVEEILPKIDTIETNNIYIITGMKPYKKIKEYFAKK